MNKQIDIEAILIERNRYKEALEEIFDEGRHDMAWRIASNAINPQPQYEEVEVAVKVCPICNIVERSAALRCYCAFGAKGTALIDGVVKYQKPIQPKVKRREEIITHNGWEFINCTNPSHKHKDAKIFAEWEE